MNTSNLKPFRLEDFKSNEETPVVHADGDLAWLAFPPSWKDLDYPVAAIYKSGQTGRYSKKGVPHTGHEVRLFFAPRKKVAPLSLDDIKPGMVFRFYGTESPIQFANVACKSYVTLPCAGSIEYSGLQKSYEYSFDCLTWHRCEKEVEA